MVALFLVVAVALVAFGGLLAACDAALNALSTAEVLELAAGARFRRSIAAIAADMGAHVNAVNFVRVLSETAAAVLVTLAVASFTPDPWLVLLIAAVIQTFVSFVLVGASPRSAGRAHPRGLLRAAAPVVRVARLALGPFADALAWLGNRVTPGRPRSAAISSEEQLLSLVDAATEVDVLEADDRELIHSIFEWGDTVVREVMVPRTDMTTVAPGLSAKKALRVFLERGFSRMPVAPRGTDDVVGVLHLRDVARAVLADGESGTAGALVRPVLFVPDSKKADDTLREMQRESIHLAMVVDEYGGIAGLVTLEDLIEELVGEISDESDRAGVDVQALGPDRWRVAARLPLDELGDLTGIPLDDEDVESVGGLLTKAIDRLPERGDRAVVGPLVLIADRTDGRRRRLTSVLVERVPVPDAEPVAETVDA